MDYSLKEGGSLGDSIGEKIETRSSSSLSEMSEEIEIPPERLSTVAKVGAIPKECLKHISTGTFENGQLKSGGHGQKGFNILKNQGLLNDVKILKNSVRIANVSNHKDISKRQSQGQTFFPESWNDNKIAMSVKDIWRKNVNNMTGTGYEKFTDWYNGVKITVGFKDGKPLNAFPEKYQR